MTNRNEEREAEVAAQLREYQRASIVAKLHGYIPFDDGDTEASLKAAHLALTGEAYRSQEEEQAENVQAAKEERQRRIEAQLDSDHARSLPMPRSTDSWTAVRFGMRSDGVSRTPRALTFFSGKLPTTGLRKPVRKWST